MIVGFLVFPYEKEKHTYLGLEGFFKLTPLKALR